MTETNTDGFVELSTEECWARLRAAGIGRLAVNNGHQPDIFPVNFLVDDDRIVIRTAEGTKLAAAIASGRVAFEIDDIDLAANRAWSVVVHGVTQEPRSTASVMHDEELSLHPLAGDEGKERYIEIVPTRITGRTIGEAE